MSYFDSAEYAKKENYFLEKIKKSTNYSNFIRDAFEDLEEEADGSVDIFMLGIEAFNLESVEIEQKDLLDLLDLLGSKTQLLSISLLNRYGLSVTSVVPLSAIDTKKFYIVNGVNGYEILREKKTNNPLFRATHKL